MSNGIRQSKRSLTQQFLTDPLVGGIVFVAIGFLKIMPIRYSSAFGGYLGKSFYYVMKKRNQIGRRNLEIAFPEKTPEEREVRGKSNLLLLPLCPIQGQMLQILTNTAYREHG